MGMREDLKIPLSMLSISFLNKIEYKGSYNGKRFMFKKTKNDNNENNNEEFILKVYIWKDLYNFEKTDKKDIVEKDFEYSKSGIDEGIDYVENYEIS